MDKANERILVHLGITVEERDSLDTLGGNFMTRNAVASLLLSAAIQAVKINNGNISLPPLLAVVTDPEECRRRQAAGKCNTTANTTGHDKKSKATSSTR